MFDNEPSIFRFFKKGNHGNHDCQKKGQRCLDLLVHSFSQNGSNLALSVSVVNPFLSSLSPHLKKVGGSRAQRESSKNKKHLTDCYKENTMFHLFVMDTYGSTSPEDLLVHLQASL